MNKVAPFLFLIIIGTLNLNAQVNYSEHIAPIIYDNCTSCHRQGEVAPFSLTSYDEVAAWSGMIEYVTAIKYMPPWKPDVGYSSFFGEKTLSDNEIQLIADWVAAGLPQGNPNLEPTLPDFPSGSQLGTPDLVIEMEEDYFIEGNNLDEYRIFVLPTGLTEDKEIAAIEFRPGNKTAVHHALIAYETGGLANIKDALDQDYGYEAFGGFGVPVDGRFTGYTPGIQTVFFPEGIGATLPANADLLLQVHYAPLPTDETDKSLLNIFYKKTEDPITREVEQLSVTPLDLDGGWFSFTIPPNEVKSFHGTTTVSEEISLISVYPHCHYLGKDWEIFAITPTNDTINIIRIEEWDFNWQGSYTFDRMKKIPEGSVIHVNASYDNTIHNPYNPSFPPITVSWGEGTTDEMYLVGMSYVPYQEGDENIVIGENISTGIEEVISNSEIQLYSPFPNPTRDAVVLNYYLNKKQKVSIELFDMKGVLVKTVVGQTIHQSGNHVKEFNVDNLPNGTYTIRLKGEDVVLTKPLVISE